MVSAVTSVHLTAACCTLSHALGLKDGDNVSLPVSNLQQYLTGGDYDDVEDLEEKLSAYKSKPIVCGVTSVLCEVLSMCVMCESCVCHV